MFGRICRELNQGRNGAVVEDLVSGCLLSRDLPKGIIRNS
jgi:hypothetical protein